MEPSLILCRAQEARQRALAGAAATLENGKLIANLAAAAWAKEGAAAERRENRKLRTRAFLEAGRTQDESPSVEDRSLSENPDRGHAIVFE